MACGRCCLACYYGTLSGLTCLMYSTPPSSVRIISAIFLCISDLYAASPLDWGLDCFYETRKDVIEQCLLRIQTESIEDLLNAAWQHEGERCVGASWQNWTREELVEIAACIGRTDQLAY